MAKSKFTTLDRLSLQDIDGDAELIPLMTPEDEEAINNEELPASLPILSLRNTVLFPGVVIPITAGRDASIKLINDANNGGKVIGVVSQKDEAVENPSEKDIYKTGTVARILKVLKMPDGNTTVIIQGKKRFKIEKVVSETPYLTAEISDIPEAKPAKDNEEFKAIILEKIAHAQEDLDLLKGAFKNDRNNGTEDTSPTFKAFEEGSESLKKLEKSVEEMKKYKNKLLVIPFTSIYCYLSGLQLFKEALPKQSSMILCAAVSDFVPREVALHKIHTSEVLNLELISSPKMLGEMVSSKHLCVSFKLETDQSKLKDRVEFALGKYGVDMVVGNCLQERNWVSFTFNAESLGER